MPPSSDHDPYLDVAVRGWAILLIGCAVFGGALVIGLRAWRFSHFPHSVATIQEVWDRKLKVPRSGGLFFEPRYETYTFGRIGFERTQKGKTYFCTQSVELGKPTDKYAVGQRLDVVPATGTCDRVDVLGRIED